MEGAQSSWEDLLMPVLPCCQPQHVEKALADLEQALDADFPVADPQAVALIKDPRQCLLLSLWNALLAQRPFQVGVVLVVRQPEAVGGITGEPRPVAVGTGPAAVAVAHPGG